MSFTHDDHRKHHWADKDRTRAACVSLLSVDIQGLHPKTRVENQSPFCVPAVTIDHGIVSTRKLCVRLLTILTNSKRRQCAAQAYTHFGSVRLLPNELSMRHIKQVLLHNMPRWAMDLEPCLQLDGQSSICQQSAASFRRLVTNVSGAVVCVAICDGLFTQVLERFRFDL